MLGCFLKVTHLVGSTGNESLYPLFLLKKGSLQNRVLQISQFSLWLSLKEDTEWLCESLSSWPFSDL